MQAEQLLDDFVAHGYAVVPDFWNAARCAELQVAVEAIWRELGEPPLFSEEDIQLAPDVNVTQVGFTLLSLFGRSDAPLPFVTDSRLIELFERCLGEAFELEQVSAVLCDQERPFFFWHSHLGGIDGADFRNHEWAPRERIDRMVCTLYCCPVNAEYGTMLVQPRSLAESTRAPYVPGREPWPGAVDLSGPIGTLVLLDEATWHAVRPMQVVGRRCFAACFVRRKGTKASRRDPSLPLAAARWPELARCYGGLLE
ncbi:MAG: hypothetical protein R3B07_17380 [Polyangiaceae bacterium]